MIDYKFADSYPDRCRAAVWTRDTYRYTGRGPGGFQMYYQEHQCNRKAGKSGYCWQHNPELTEARDA